ncbi:hypothetical protein SEA_HERCULESXL_3 [Microbacterium phage HerculesXL]|nr:hypothetical protein SEA_HERCULESXL_3 [Microbacterium phage HerculesXL]
MTYTLHDSSGQPVAGDATAGQPMRDRADELHGYIVDDTTGETIYPNYSEEG